VGFQRLTAFHDLEIGGEFAGLQVRVRHISGEGLVAYAGLEPLPTHTDPFSVLPLWAEFVDSWNLMDGDGRAIPPTGAALMGQDPEFIRGVLGAYLVTLDQPYPSTVAPVVAWAPPVDPAQQVLEPVSSAAVISDAPDAEDMDIPAAPGPDLSHLEMYLHDAAPIQAPQPVPA
jgi:hypothetical protein